MKIIALDNENSCFLFNAWETNIYWWRIECCVSTCKICINFEKYLIGNEAKENSCFCCCFCQCLFNVTTQWDFFNICRMFIRYSLRVMGLMSMFNVALVRKSKCSRINLTDFSRIHVIGFSMAQIQFKASAPFLTGQCIPSKNWMMVNNETLLMVLSAFDWSFNELRMQAVSQSRSS